MKRKMQQWLVLGITGVLLAGMLSVGNQLISKAADVSAMAEEEEQVTYDAAEFASF